jgi:hypothetical protein
MADISDPNRYIYDYTVVHSAGGENSPVLTRSRSSPKKEVAYISPTNGE